MFYGQFLSIFHCCGFAFHSWMWCLTQFHQFQIFHFSLLIKCARNTVNSFDESHNWRKICWTVTIAHFDDDIWIRAGTFLVVNTVCNKRNLLQAHFFVNETVSCCWHLIEFPFERFFIKKMWIAQISWKFYESKPIERNKILPA